MTAAARSDRLVQIGKFYPPELGGIETFTLNLAEGVAARGYRSEVVAFTNGANRIEQLGGVIVERVRAGVTIVSQPLSLRWLIRAIQRARSADAVLIHYPNVLAIAAVTLLGRPRLVTYWHSDVVGKGLVGRLAGVAETYLLRRSDLILASTRAYAEASPRLKQFRNKLAVLPIGVADVPAVNGQALPDEIMRFLGDGDHTVLAIGRLVKYKGFDTLVRAAALMPQGARVVIVGTGPEAGALQALVDKSGLSHKVLLAGRLQDTAVQALLRCAAVYVMCSVERSEAYGIVQIEAMAHGLPIVASDIRGSGVPEVADWGNIGALVAPGDAAELADAVTKVLEHGNDALRRRSRARYEESFTLTRMVDHAIDLLFSGENGCIPPGKS